MRWLVVTYLAVSIGTAAAAPDTGEIHYTVVGAGTASCAAWTEDRRNVQSWSALVDQAWLAGYITARNYEVGGNVMSETDVSGVNGWLDNYCAVNPLDDISKAAEALVIELRTRKRR